MKRLFLLVFAGILSLSVSAQETDAYKQFASCVKDSRAEFTYSYSMGTETRMTGKGKAIVQDACFYLNGNDLEVYCDSRCAASIDRVSKEVILETVDGEDCGNYVNPAQMVTAVTKHFKCVSQTRVRYADTTVVKVVLEPRTGMNVLRITLYLQPDGKALRALSMTSEDGSVSDFDIPTFRFVPKGSEADFKLDTKSLGAGYVITDLR